MSRLGCICITFTLAASACKRDNSLFCEGAPHNNCLNVDAPGEACTSSAECSPQVCDVTGTMTCVECTAAEDEACTGAKPVCVTNVCQACTAHSQCDSLACLPDGSCGDDTNVAYVDPAGTDNASCTKAMPCTEVAKALATTRSFLKFTGTTDEAVVVDNGRVVTFLADPGAKLTRGSGGAILTVRDNATSLTVYDLSISDAPNNASGFGIVVPTASGAPSVSLARVTLSNNPGGGISLSGAEFDITNSFIVKNGTPSSLVGGIEFSQILGAGTHRLDFNTIANNIGNATVNSGVNCGTVVTPVSFTSNIIFGNTVSGGGKQFGGSVNCATTFSDIGPDTTAGTGNINMDPLFVNVSQGNFHLMPGSPAKDGGDPAATLDADVDGDPRPQGAARDMGADEVL